VRELREETQVGASADEVLTVLDVIHRSESGELLQHFVLIAVRCLWHAGEPHAADDALEARWFTLDEVGALGAHASAKVGDVARLALGRGSAVARQSVPDRRESRPRPKSARTMRCTHARGS